MEKVRIEKLVHGGQGMGQLADGRKIFVWNSLPGELVEVEIKKGKRSYAEGVAINIIEPSPDRVETRDTAYLSTSPWQIMTLEAENRYKAEILKEAFAREKLQLPEFDFISEGSEWQYRNKMEYSFWGDDDGLHLALFNRGTHGKQIITGTSIARPEIDEAANKICEILNEKHIRAGQLKTVMLRCNASGEVVAALFVKDDLFPEIIELKEACKGLAVWFSNPKSPASVRTKELYTFGDISLTDIVGKEISYDVHSFFQVNLPIFSRALARIKSEIGGQQPVIDFYSGVGTLGIVNDATKLVESDPGNIQWAKQNTAGQSTEIIEASAETAADYILNTGVLIVDPPRAGLHKHVVDTILEKLPPSILYLSCNPATQARDIKLLSDHYIIHFSEGYNFFPKTPHIENLVVLTKKS